ncbi:MAG TPA: thioredoxin family protein [Gemmatimonadales bacterium]|nr:thioredoxin family protein [Gemmatimonadales bacterium]
MSTLTPLPPLDLVPVWEQALSYESFVAAASEDHRPLWEAIGRTHAPSEASLELRLPEGSRLLVIAEDWCGDAVNVIPALHNWAVATGVEMRLIERDLWPRVMDRYLTGDARAIPIVIILGRDGNEIGHWGPRPAEIQAWDVAHRRTMEKAERYKEVRRWYARDRGASTIREVVAAAAPR